MCFLVRWIVFFLQVQIRYPLRNGLAEKSLMENNHWYMHIDMFIAMIDFGRRVEIWNCKRFQLKSRFHAVLGHSSFYHGWIPYNIIQPYAKSSKHPWTKRLVLNAYSWCWKISKLRTMNFTLGSGNVENMFPQIGGPSRIFPHIFVWASCFWLCTSASSFRQPPTITTQLAYTTYVTTQLAHTTYSHTTCTHTQTQLAHTTSTRTHTHTTCSHTTYSQLVSPLTHTQLVTTQLAHTTYSHTTYSHTTCHHTTYSHTQLTHNLLITTNLLTQLAHTQLTHTQLTRNLLLTHNLLTHNLSPHNLLTHTQWHTHTHTLLTLNLRGRRGTWWHRPSLCVAGVALMALALVGALGSHLTPLSPRLFAWQAWHLVTSTSTLHGRRGTWRHRRAFCVAGVALMALDWLWWCAWFPVDAVVAAALCVAGVALGDVDLDFAWQAWHLVTWTCTLRGRRGTYLAKLL